MEVRRWFIPRQRRNAQQVDATRPCLLQLTLIFKYLSIRDRIPGLSDHLRECSRAWPPRQSGQSTRQHATIDQSINLYSSKKYVQQDSNSRTGLGRTTKAESIDYCPLQIVFRTYTSKHNNNNYNTRFHEFFQFMKQTEVTWSQDNTPAYTSVQALAAIQNAGFELFRHRTPTVFAIPVRIAMHKWLAGRPRTTILLQLNQSFGETLEQVHFSCRRLRRSVSKLRPNSALFTIFKIRRVSFSCSAEKPTSDN